MQEMPPPYWITFLDKNHLRGRFCRINESEDASGIGADFVLFNEHESRDEATNFHPGIIVSAHGYVPVGGCLSGSGDQYFININEGSTGSLYRIYHDAVTPEHYDADEAIALVLKAYAKLLDHVA